MRRGGQGGDGDEAEVGCARGEAAGAFAGDHAVDAVAEGKLLREWGMFEIPHEGGGIEEVDGCNPQPGILLFGHAH